VSVDY